MLFSQDITINFIKKCVTVYKLNKDNTINV